MCSPTVETTTHSSNNLLIDAFDGGEGNNVSYNEMNNDWHWICNRGRIALFTLRFIVSVILNVLRPYFKYCSKKNLLKVVFLCGKTIKIVLHFLRMFQIALRIRTIKYGTSDQLAQMTEIYVKSTTKVLVTHHICLGSIRFRSF